MAVAAAIHKSVAISGAANASSISNLNATYHPSSCQCPLMSSSLTPSQQSTAKSYQQQRLMVESHWRGSFLSQQGQTQRSLVAIIDACTNDVCLPWRRCCWVAKLTGVPFSRTCMFCQSFTTPLVVVTQFVVVGYNIRLKGPPPPTPL